MTSDILNKKYFNWMYKLVCDGVHNEGKPYHKLLTHLHNREFYYILDMDGNRADDGVDLRYRFAYENHYDYAAVATYLDNKECSVLEMMVALAIRCEDDNMGDPNYGNRTGQWFFTMVESLGLKDMYDNNYNEQVVDNIVDIFLDRGYKRNGEGGLFTIKNRRRDMRTAEIWYQMCWYLDDL